MQDSFGNPIPNPVPNTEPDPIPTSDAPATESPIADTPVAAETPTAETPVAPTETPSTPVETLAPAEPVPAFDAPTSETPVAETPAETAAPASAPEQSTAPVTTPAPEQPAAPVIAPASSGKSHGGLIIGIIIAVLVIGIIVVAAILIPQIGKNDTKKENDTSKNEEKKAEEPQKPEKEEKAPEKTAAKGLEVGFNGKSFVIAKNYVDTVKSLLENYSGSVYYVDDDYNEIEITDIDTFSGTTSNTGFASVVLYDNEKDEAFKIQGSVPLSERSDDDEEDVEYKISTFETGTIYFWADTGKTVKISGKDFTIGKTTAKEVEELLGAADDVDTDENDNAEYITYDDIDNCEVVFFMETDESGESLVRFLTFDYNK